jgi:hypothetical protein
MWRRTVDCLGVAVGIISRVDELEPTLDAVFASYAEAEGAADIEYEIDGPALSRDGAELRRCAVAIDLVAVLELDLYREVMARAGGLLLHAGALVGAGGRALVFAGRSGAGKSTLVRALLGRGFAYLTEECVALERGACRGLARALHVDDERVSPPAGFTVGEYPIRQASGEVVVTRLFHPPERAIWRGPARAAAVVSIEHAPDAAAALQPLSGGEALARLWPAVFRPDSTALADAGAALEGVARYHLVTARPEQAIDRALSLAAELGVEPA